MWIIGRVKSVFATDSLRIIFEIAIEPKLMCPDHIKVSIKFLSFAVVVILSLIACKKNHTDEPAAIPKVRELSFIFQPNSSQPEPSQVDFSYDNYDRVKSILVYLGNSDIAIPSTDTMTTVNFFYNGSAKLPYLIFIKRHLNGGVTESHLLSYDASDRIVKDSILNQYSIYYSYNSDKTIRNNTSPGGWGKDTLISENGNYTQVKQLDQEIHRDFDNKINPLNYLNIGPIYHVIEMYGGIWSLWTASNQNNMLEEKVYSAGIFQYNRHKAVYIYNNEGLPQKRIWYYTYNPQDVIDTMFYKY